MKTIQKYLNTSKGRIYTQSWQPEVKSSDIPLIMMHDSLGSVAQWRELPHNLANMLCRPVIAYDRAGFGLSDARITPPSNRFMTEEALIDFPEFKQKMEISQFFLLGHSVGGTIAINVAAQDKDCLGLVSISSPSLVEEQTLSSIQSAKETFRDETSFSRLAKWHGNKAKWVLSAWVDVWLRPELKNWQLLEASNVLCPMLLIHGKDDEYGSVAFPQFIAQHAKGATQVVLLEDCGHLPHVTHKEKVNESIHRFFEPLNVIATEK